MIKLEKIHKVYNGEVVALRDINLLIPEGEFVVLVGANGSGKSTLLNILAGTVTPDQGKISIAGREITKLPEHNRSKWMARVFQNPLAGTASELTVLENFRLAAIRSQSKSLRIGTNQAFRGMVQERIAGLGLGLENKINQSMGTLSGGQRQALTLLMAVMDDADVLLLDEPTAALDPKTAATIMKIADGLIRQHKLSAILVTHNLKDAVNFGNRIIQMSEGAVVRDLQKAEKSNLTVNDVFEWFE